MTRLRELASAWGFGQVPGTPEEVREYLQRRLRLYLGACASFWGGSLVAWLALVAVVQPRLLRDEGWQLGNVLQGLGTCVVVGAWLVARSGKRSVAHLSLADAAATLVQASMLAYISLGQIIGYRPELTALLGITNVLVVRAALVPSTATRTAALGGMSCVPILVATYLSYARAAGPESVSPAVYAVIAGIWSAMAIGSTTVISRVVYGLEKRARALVQLGQYVLEDKIGEGGMGQVFRARHELLRRPTAIKLLPPGRAGASALKRFEREVQMTSLLTHPNTIVVFDYGSTPQGVFYYVMEYLDGLDLEALVALDGPQPAGRVIHLLRQVAGSLAEAHEAGLIHRDVKPSNVIVCRRGLEPDFVKVLDFGLVRETEAGAAELSNADTLVGTPRYMSPEQVTQPALVDARADLYALGAIGYFLVTGTPPFVANNTVEVLYHHMHTTPERPATRLGNPVPADLERLLLLCLEKDPAARPADGRALLAELEACAATSPWTTADASAWWRAQGRGSIEVKAARRAAGDPRALTVDLQGR